MSLLPLEVTDLRGYSWLALSAIMASFVNTLAGGGSLISFPALTGFGLSALVANVTNSVALMPGYLAAVQGSRRDLHGQGSRIVLLVPPALIGGVVGSQILLTMGQSTFLSLVPWLLLLGSLLLAVQEPLQAMNLRNQSKRRGSVSVVWSIVAIFLAGLYGGFFGAGMGVIVLAVLTLLFDDDLIRLNSLKQAISLAVNLAALPSFLISGLVQWPAAFVMAFGAVIGGIIGGHFSGKVNPRQLRILVVLIGLILSLVFFLR